MAVVSLGVAPEANPVMATCLAISPALFLVVKLAVVDLSVAALLWAYDSRWARLALYIVLAVYAGVIAWYTWHFS